MSECVITKGPDQKLQGFGKKGVQDYDRWKRAVAGMRVGDTLRFSWSEPRSRNHHRLFFKKLNTLFERQDRFDQMKAMRLWLTAGAGYCTLAPGRDGVLVAIPDSLDFESMDEGVFSALHRDVDAFLRGEHAGHFLWPHLTPLQQTEMVETLLAEFSGEATPA